MAGRFSVDAVFRAVDRVSAPVSRMQDRVGRMTRAMNRGLRRADRALRTVGRVGFGAMKAGAVAAAAAITTVYLALNKTTAKADALAKQSRRLQFPIEELQEWKFAAEQSGVSNELLDKSLGAFSKRLGEAKGGVGPLVSGLKKLNPELLKQLQGTDDISEALEIYIEAIRQTDGASEQAALANAAFSRSGLQMVDIAKNSAKAVEDLRLEQRENGNITMEQAENAEAYGDAMNALSRSIEGFINSVLLPMTPMLTKLIREFREWIVANKELIGTNILKFGRDLVENFTDIVATIKKVGYAIATVIAFSLALKSLIAIITLVNLVMLANPLVLIVTAIAVAVIGLAALIYFYWGDIKKFFTNLWSDFRVLMADFIDWAVDKMSVFSDLPQTLKDAWSSVGTFFTELWADIVAQFDSAVARIMSIVDKIMGAVNKIKNAASGVVDSVSGTASKISDTASGAFSSVKNFVGFGDDDDETDGKAAPQPKVVSSQDRLSSSIQNVVNNSKSEVTIKDETGRAEVTKKSQGAGIQLQRTGAFI